MPTTGSRLLAVTPSFSLVCLTRMAFSRLAGFSGTAPGSFPNSSITPFRIAISMSSSLFSRRCRSTSASSSSRRARVSASLFSSAATASARPAASRGPAAAGGMAAGVEGSTPVFPSPAVGGFSPGVFVTCVSLDPASICRFQFPDDGRLHAQFGGRLA